ncbi:hypothetical protein CsSME_00031456 [Camellia sinensis var. sinensis]
MAIQELSWDRSFPSSWLWLSGLDVMAMRSEMLIGFHFHLYCVFVCYVLTLCVSCLFAHISTPRFHLLSLVVGVTLGQQGYMGKVGAYLGGSYKRWKLNGKIAANLELQFFQGFYSIFSLL